MAYTTVANIEAKLGIALTADQIQYFNTVLSIGIDEYINYITGSVYNSISIVSVYESGSGSEQLVIPTMYDITAVAQLNGITESIVSTDSYSFYPRGKNFVYAIRNLNGFWAEGYDNIKITGKLGYPTLPTDIVNVATEIAANEFTQNTLGYKSEKVGDWSATYAEGGIELSALSNSVMKRYTRLSRRI